MYSLSLVPGKYIVCEVQQAAGSSPSRRTRACGAAAGGWGITLTSGQTRLRTTTSATSSRATKTGTKFNDLNGNGVKDAGEPGLPGWTINAYADTNGNGIRDAGENTIAATGATDAAGVYSLSLNPGAYVVCEVQQATWTQSFPAGTACGASAGGWGIILTSGQLDSDNNFGNFQQATKTGTKFDDLNANGAKDAGEPGLPGWVINAYADTNGNGTRDVGENTIAATDTTNASGVYSLSLNPGKYVVCEVQQATWTQSFPAGTACGAARRRLGHHAGLGRPGLRQRLRQLPPGDEDRHEVQRPERRRRQGRRRARPARLGRSTRTPMRTATASVTRARTPIAATDTTNASGDYSLTLTPGKYVVCEVQQATWIQSYPANEVCGRSAGGWAITLTSGQLDCEQRLRQLPAGDQVRHEVPRPERQRREGRGRARPRRLDDPRVRRRERQRRTVDLERADRGLRRSPARAARTRMSLAARQVHRRARCSRPAGRSPTRRPRRAAPASARLGDHPHVGPARLGQRLRELDDGHEDRHEVPRPERQRRRRMRASPAFPAGRSTPTPMRTATASATLGENTVAATDADERGRRLHAEPQSRQVRRVRGAAGGLDPVLPGRHRRAATGLGGYGITLASSELDSGNDFGNYQKATKTGMKFNDLNANGVEGRGEPGLAGWTINAYVDANGNGTRDAGETAIAATDTTERERRLHAAASIPASTWCARCSRPAGSSPSRRTPRAVPTAGGWGITLASGERDVDNDFGNYQAATKTGMKFHDLNGDGVKDAGEPGLPGWTINAYADTNGNGIRDAGEDTIAATGATDAGGDYSARRSTRASTWCARCSRRRGSSPTRRTRPAARPPAAGASR